MYEKVKAEHQKSAGLLQPMLIPKWKQDKLGMDFITRFPRTRTGYDSIWVIVYSLDQSGSLYPRENHLYKCEVGQDIYLRKDRMSAWSSEDHRRGTQFTSKFWNQLHQTLGTRLEFSTAFHPQTDG